MPDTDRPESNGPPASTPASGGIQPARRSGDAATPPALAAGNAIPPPPPPPASVPPPVLARTLTGDDRARQDDDEDLDSTIKRGSPRGSGDAFDIDVDATIKRGGGDPHARTMDDAPPPAVIHAQAPRTVAEALGMDLRMSSVHLRRSDDDDAPTRPPARAPLSQLGRYAIRGELGRGGMGAVLIAADRDLGRDVAMKVMLGVADTEALVRFLREARVSGQLEHPNITPVHELGLDGRRPYFTMKLVRGEALSRRIARLHAEVQHGRGDGEFALTQRLDVFRKICDGLAYAHSRGVVHRDLKPENVMVGAYGEVQVMDWGLARIIDDTHEDLTRALRQGSGADTPATIPPTMHARADENWRTLEGDVMGTPSYMSPEQARGDTSKIDARSDIYALGAILYELLTLTRAFEGHELLKLLERVRRGRFVSPSRRVASDRVLAAALRVPRELDAVVMKAMATRPHDRYASVADLVADIDAWAEGRATSAAQYSLAQLGMLWVRRHRVAVSVAAALVAVVGIAIAAVLQSTAAAREQALAQHRTAVASAAAAANAIRAQVDAGDFAAAVDACTAFRAAHLQPLIAAETNDSVHESAPGLAARAGALPAEVRAMRDGALRAWIATELAALPPPDRRITPEQVEATRRAQARFAPWLTEPALADLPVARFARWRALLAENTGNRELLAASVADAFIVQPDSEAAGECFLLLADAAFRDNVDLPATSADVRFDEIATQYHLALSSFGDRHPALRPHALLGLVRTLVRLDRFAPTPFAPDVPSREMALRCVLRLVKPDGTLRDDIRPYLSGDAGDAGREFAREAADWLRVLRRLTVSNQLGGDAVDMDGDGINDAMFSWSRKEATVSIVRVREPSGSGLIPAVVEPIRMIDLAPTLARYLPAVEEGVRSVTRVELVHAVPGLALPQLLVVVNDDGNGKDQRVSHILLIGMEDDRLYLQLPIRTNDRVANLVETGVGDLDGDGNPDLVLAFLHTIMVVWQAAPGRFDPRVATVDADASSLRALLIHDLDGDGQNEMIAGWGAWSRMSVEIWSLRGRVARRTVAQRLGEPTIVVVPGTRGPLLVVSPVVPYAIGFFFRTHGEPLDDPRLRVFRYDGSVLQSLEPGFETIDNEEFNGAVHGALLQCEGVNALVEARSTDRRSVNVWTLFDGSLDAPTNLRTMRILGAAPRREPLAGYLPTRDGVFRPLTDADLAVVAREPIPLRLPPQGEAVPVTVARFMLALHLPAEAVRTVRAAGEPGTMALRHELKRLELLALTEARQFDELIAVVEQLEPARELVNDLLAAVRVVSDTAARYEDAARMLDRWCNDMRLTTDQRAQLIATRQAWRDVVETRDTTMLDIQGRRVEQLRYAAMKKREGRRTVVPYDLADLLLATDVGLIRPDPSDPQGPLRVQSAAINSSVVLRQRLPGDDDAGNSIGVTAVAPLVGVPIEVGIGDWWLSIEFTLVAYPYYTSTRFGLMPLDQLTGAPGLRWARESPIGMLVTCNGGNHVNKINMRGMVCDRYIGRRLRLVYESTATDGITRLSVYDVASRELVHTGSFRDVAGGMVVLGLQQTSDRHCEILLHRLSLGGPVQIVEPDNPTLQLLTAATPDVSLISRIARAQFAGRTAECGELLRQYIARLEATLPALSGSDRKLLQKQIARCRIEAAFNASDSDPRAFAAALDSSICDGELRDWMLGGLQLLASPDAWQCVGEAIWRRHFADVPDAATMMRRLQTAPAPGRLDPHLVAALACRTAQLMPGSAEARTLWLLSLARLVPPADNLLFAATPAAWRYLDQSADLSTVTALQSGLRAIRAGVLGGMSRREEALATLTADDPEPRVGFRMHHQLLIERDQRIARDQRLRAVASGIRYRDIPRPQEHD